MMKSLLRTREILLLLGVALVAGCTTGSGLVGVPPSNPGGSAPSQAGAGAPTALPATDAGLAEHVPQQLIIRFLPGASIEPVLSAIQGTVLRELKTFNAAVVDLPPGASIVDTIRKVQFMSGVKYVEPNYIYRLSLTPNDLYFATKQWGPQKIGAPAAWDATTGGSTSVIAILDSGVSSIHPDFMGIMGKILTGSNCVTPGGSTDDNVGHGTHVAGIAAAIGNNNIGIAGISWLSPILPIKVADSSGLVTTGTEVCGLDFAAGFAANNPGDQVSANMSFGGAGYSQLVKDAVDLAISKNVVLIAAAGNDGKATVLFPAGYPGVMAVGATDPSNNLATFSTHGSQLSVVAPGVDIYSTLPTSGPVSAPIGYGYLSGTSMAAPHVTGVAALVRAKNPTFTVSQVRSQIEKTATNLPTAGGGFNPQFGWGLVNAAAAVGVAQTNNYGSVLVTVTKAGANTGGVDVVIWTIPTGAIVCTTLSQPLQTAQTSSTGTSVGVATFNAVPAGSYCATASQASPPAKGTTAAPFTVPAGGTTTPPPTILIM